MKNSKISWCDHSFNPWIGCDKVSPGCQNCYAERSAPVRVLRARGVETWGPKGTPQRTSANNWRQPVLWNREAVNNRQCSVCGATGEDINPEQFCRHCEIEAYPISPRVFCGSLCDWLDDSVPIEWLADLLELIHDTPNLNWLLLTKRPLNFGMQFDTLRRLTWPKHRRWIDEWYSGEPPSNVWIGATVEDQQRADERIPQLLSIPAKVRFLSCEPLLGEIDLQHLGNVDGPDLSNGIQDALREALLNCLPFLTRHASSSYGSELLKCGDAIMAIEKALSL